MNDRQFNIQESVISSNQDDLLMEHLLMKTQNTVGSQVSPLKEFKMSNEKIVG